MAFGAEELRVLRRALALALHPGHVSAEDVQDCYRLAESLDEAMREGARLRAFLVADLARYRAALPGTAAGYLALLEEALGAGHRPVPDDLAALRALRGNPAAAALLDRCRELAEQDVRARFAQGARKVPAPAVPPARTRLLALAGGAGEFGVRQEDGQAEEPQKPPRKPAPKPAPGPSERPAPGPDEPEPAEPKRPIPTPGEVFPRRKPAPPTESRQLAAG
ncbi:hypothetical protein JK361_21235 [Streptomyces sp. 5-8]|uniref:Uncharacterized protein n=1 Tax=Streptomyces musisoli TaxID=2802280 RepID=A0ABS1P3Y9_9ACTN|nr:MULTISPECIES: hypothetical protein [Streptomyces]MBL1107097.1 hypothetical protein [Streptomyces musisoli]MBY8841984.1 hypothetical protein [Streptomyces sp. SP2-10]